MVDKVGDADGEGRVRARPTPRGGPRGGADRAGPPTLRRRGRRPTGPGRPRRLRPRVHRLPGLGTRGARSELGGDKGTVVWLHSIRVLRLECRPTPSSFARAPPPPPPPPTPPPPFASGFYPPLFVYTSTTASGSIFVQSVHPPPWCGNHPVTSGTPPGSNPAGSFDSTGQQDLIIV